MQQRSLSIASASTCNGRIIATRATTDVSVTVACRHRTLALLPSEDRFFGHQELATQCATWVRNFLRDHNAPTQPRACSRCPPLDQFIAYILRATRLAKTTVLYALCLIEELSDASKDILVKNIGTVNAGHRLLLPALMVSAKFTNDDNHNNASWMVAALELFTLQEVTKMEKDLLQLCDWKLGIDLTPFTRFADNFSKAFATRPAEPFIERDMTTHRLMDGIL